LKGSPRRLSLLRGVGVVQGSKFYVPDFRFSVSKGVVILGRFTLTPRVIERARGLGPRRLCL